MDKSRPSKDLDDTQRADPREGDEWTTLGIALPRSLKTRFEILAERKHLAPSVYGRILIDEAVTRHEQAA
jgi:hypothetical protein